MENWIQFTLMGKTGKKRMKQHVVPHRFDCQKDRKRASSPPLLRQAFLKRNRLDLHKEVEDSAEVLISTETCSPTVVEEVHTEVLPSTSGYKDFGCQVLIKPYVRSKYVQFTPSLKKSASSPFKVIMGDMSTSMPEKIAEKGIPSDLLNTTLSSTTLSSKQSTDSYKVESSSTNESDFKTECENEFLKTTSASRIVQIIKRQPRLYIGIPEESYFIIELLRNEINISETNILLVLKKIRLNNSFAELADDFGISKSQASKIFRTNVHKIANSLKKFIFWPSPHSIKKNLPLAFRARYHNVQSIIDALWIEIEKPSDPIMQALSWSEYKKCNTIKYLVSSTPDGLINYISPGFSGRISDTTLTEECDYLHLLPHGAAVMADRGFKHIEQSLLQIGCKLIRPPSVEAKRKPTKQEVLETKRIASLRIHIERTIRRIREFKFLKPHSCINNKLISLTDDVIIIAAAFVNIQESLIKK